MDEILWLINFDIRYSVPNELTRIASKLIYAEIGHSRLSLFHGPNTIPDSQIHANAIGLIEQLDVPSESTHLRTVTEKIRNFLHPITRYKIFLSIAAYTRIGSLFGICILISKLYYLLSVNFDYHPDEERRYLHSQVLQLEYWFLKYHLRNVKILTENILQDLKSCLLIPEITDINNVNEPLVSIPIKKK